MFTLYILTIKPTRCVYMCCIYPMQWMGLIMIWNGSEKDQNVRSDCEEDEGTDCEDRDSDTDS